MPGECLPDAEHSTEQILNMLQLTHSIQHRALERDSPPLSRPEDLTPVGDYMEACTEAVANAVLVLFINHLAVAHPHPVAILEELPGGFFPSSCTRNLLGVCASIRPPVH